jgi:glycosyltransferase involved in cell wall biosynthesis
MTTKNDEPTVRAALDSLLANTSRDDAEIVVVDSQSTDGQLPILQGYAKAGLIKLIVKKCNRGEGRQIALNESKGDYIISGVDTDDEIGPALKGLLARYHKEFEGYVLHGIGITIAPRKVVDSLGGWNPLFCGEDFDFWQRAEAAGVLRSVAIDPYVFRVRRHHGVIHTTRVLWRYAVQQRHPVVSWKWKPVWALVRFLRSLATLGRSHTPPATFAENPGKP